MTAQAKARVDLGTPIGIVLGLVAVVGSWVVFEGGSLAALTANVSPMIIVFGGTLMCLLIAFPLPVVLNLPRYLRKAFMDDAEDPVVIVRTFVRLAEKARREGLLSLEEEARAIPDEFLRNGIQEVVDGTPPEEIKDLLEAEIAEMEARHRLGADLFEQGGGFAPTMGIIGTVLGLMSTLGSMAHEGTESLGEHIAVAFIATFFGILSSNFVWLPLAKRLRRKSETEVAYRRMIVEGILGIQAGSPPRLVGAKLESFLSPADRARLRRGGEPGGAAAPAAAGA
jgi:chemotaxis protein MotA